ncbi:MAG: nitroreductase family protein [Lachnospiraceae bacterium]|nr:nitroreductase family protein [Lachnospiraceae bacterium]
MDIMELLYGRRTYRRFAQKKVPENTLHNILEAARISSSAANKQSLRYIIVQKPEEVASVCDLVKWAAYLPAEVGTPKENERPTLFIAVLQPANGSVTDHTDAGIALSNMTLAAWADGVGSCIMGAINRPKLTELFGLPEDYAIHSMVAFGYPVHKSSVVPVKNGDIKYYLDENKDYLVPKRAMEDIVWNIR